MIRITQISLSVHHTEKQLVKKILSTLKISEGELVGFNIVRQSLDARKKHDIRYIYTVDVKVRDLRHLKPGTYSIPKDPSYKVPECGSRKLSYRPVIVGAGPAGLFAGLNLAGAGYRPLIIERGATAGERKIKVEDFWNTGKLDPDCNVSFGEGGAGTFSDGKLNTLVKDEKGRNAEVLRIFAEFGADSDILYVQKPHIGTDRLINIITQIRKRIEELGGEVRFNTRLSDIGIENGRVSSVRLSGCSREDKAEETIPCSVLVIATGHSGRDTYELLKRLGIPMERKAFAVGMRIQHPQSMIDVSQFGEKEAEYLSPASYKLTGQSPKGRGVYTFCMCPGGYVVDASSEEGMLCVNGMSYHGRSSGTANSALIVQVTPDDFGGDDILSGIEFQRRLESSAYRAGRGRIPVQLLGDYLNRRASTSFGDVEARLMGRYEFARLDEALPAYIHESIMAVIPDFDRRIQGFGRADAVLAGVESRTSSPVRILRGEDLMSRIEGIYPCGEGAGYAGGITSAAMDGLRVSEAIIERYSPL